MKRARRRVVHAAASSPGILFDAKRVSLYPVRKFGLVEVIEH
jgi:hypothetical protein